MINLFSDKASSHNLKICVTLLFLKILAGNSREAGGSRNQDNETYWKEVESEAKRYVDNEFFDIVTPSFAAIRDSKSFIDKTGLIKEILTFKQPFLYLTAPPCFSKSINLDMLKRFLDAPADNNGTLMEITSTPNYKLFEKTALFTQDKPFFVKHNQQYKVISLNFQLLSQVNSFESFKTEFCTIIYYMMAEHWYLQKQGSNFSWFKYTRSEDSCRKYCLEGFTNGYVVTSGKFLSEELYKTYEKPIVVLGDGYSAILNAFLKNDVAEAPKIWAFLLSFVSNLVKDNPSVHRAVFVGTLTLGGVTSLLADNVIHYNFNDRVLFAKYFGFTQRDVDSLMVRFEMTNTTQELQQWFDGYTIKDDPNTILYSPLPITNFLAKGNISDCWVHLGDYSYLKSFISRPEIGREMQRILMGDPGNYPSTKQLTTLAQMLTLRKYIADPNIKNVPTEYVNIFIQYLTENGFFTPDRKNTNLLKPANFEISEHMDRWLYTTDFLIDSLKVSFGKLVNYANALNSLSESETSVQNLAETIHFMFVNKCPLSDERVDFLGVLHGALESYHVDVAVGGFTEVSIDPLKRPGKVPKFYKWGKTDMLVITNGMVGIIIEPRLRSSPDVALRQIVDNRYFEVFQQEFPQHELSHKILLGVNLDDSCTCTISYLWDSTDLKNVKHVTFPAGGKK